MKARIISIVIMFICLFLMVANGVFILREIVEVYNFKISLIPDNYLFNTITSLNTYKILFTVTDTLNIIGWSMLGYYLLNSLLSFYGRFYSKKSYSQADEYGSHGTSRWLTKEEIKNKFYKDQLGWFLGTTEKNVLYKTGIDAAYHPVNGDLNMQMTIVGPPGSQKTTGFVLPNIFHIPYSYKKANLTMPDMIITDPKSELFSLTSDFLEKEGYEVRVLDYIHLKYGDSLNNIDFITEDKELMEIASGYISVLNPGNKGEFWEKASALLLASLIGFVIQVYPPERRNFTEIGELVSSDDIADEKKALELFKKNNVTGTPMSLYKKYLLAKEKVRDNILISLATDLTLFSIKGIQDITSSTTVDIRKLGAKKDRPMALFIFMPDGDRTFSPIINMTVTTIYNQLYKTAYNYKNKLYTPVYFIKEEMANIGKIPGIQEKLGTMRGRRIYPMMIWQSLSQMKDRYKDGWEDILSMCDTQIYLGVNDDFTAKYCSNQLGETTVKVQGVSRNNEGFYGKNRETESLNYQQRKLLFPAECKSFDNDKFILIQRASNPVKLQKVQYRYWEKENQLCEEKDIFSMENLSNKTGESYNLPESKEIEKDELSIKNPLEHFHDVEKENSDKDEISIDDSMNILDDIKDIEKEELTIDRTKLEPAFTIDDLDL